MIKKTYKKIQQTINLNLFIASVKLTLYLEYEKSFEKEKSLVLFDSHLNLSTLVVTPI